MKTHQSFIPREVVDLARAEMNVLCPSLTDKYLQTIDFIVRYPQYLPCDKKAAEPDFWEKCIRQHAKRFISGRTIKGFSMSHNPADPAISTVVKGLGFNPACGSSLLAHSNVVNVFHRIEGYAVESYLAIILESQGWSWCSGASVRKIDFIKPPSMLREAYKALQVKNSNTTENSSSKAIRDGTAISLWCRRNRNTGCFNWDSFPDPAKCQMSEDGFQQHLYSIVQEMARGGDCNEVAQLLGDLSHQQRKDLDGIHSRGRFIPNGIPLRLRYKGVIYMAVVRRGVVKLTTTINGNQYFCSLSSAAAAISGHPENGWADWWMVSLETGRWGPAEKLAIRF